jgi:sigma-B regulation protein RsbU (phosphoserine phosphatase)
MSTSIPKIPFKILIHRGIRYVLVTNTFRFVQLVVVLAILSFLLTGNRLAAIDRLGNRADIVASIIVTLVTLVVLQAVNHRVMRSIDRHFYREPYNAQRILIEVNEAILGNSQTRQLVELVGNKIKNAVHPENVTIFVEGERADEYVATFSVDASEAVSASPGKLNSLLLRFGADIADALRQTKQIDSVDVDELQPSDLTSVVENRNTLRAIHSVLLIPIASNGRLHGLVSLGRRLSNLAYTTEDKRLLLVIASQVARFMENMKLINHIAEERRSARELEMAAEVQRRLFPPSEFEDETLEIYGATLPALGVGGDYFDYFEMDGRRTGLAIADVAGKGIAAALLMSTVQASLRCQLVSSTKPLSQVVSSMNRLLRQSTGDAGYATFFLAEFDKATKRLTYVNAGHNPPMLIREQHAIAAYDMSPTSNLKFIRSGVEVGVVTHEKPVVRLLPTGGPIIGTFLNEPYEQETVEMQAGDIVVAYTDGVTEALNSNGVEFGEERLRSAAIKALHQPAREVAKQIIAKVSEWQDRTPQHDDITLIVARVK